METLIDYESFKAYMVRIQSANNIDLIDDIHNSLLYKTNIIQEFTEENPDADLIDILSARQQINYLNVLVLEIRLRLERGIYDE